MRAFVQLRADQARPCAYELRNSGGTISLCGMTNSDAVAFLRADIERFCGELVELAPAVRLQLVTELRTVLDEVTTAALTAGMAAAKQEGWGLRRIAAFTGVSHEQVRRLLAASAPAPAPGSTAPNQDQG
jgi:class 3 adenylate cyclase